LSASVTRLRLANQQITWPRFTSAAALVEWMGAVQAQDYLGSLWAVGLRLRDAVQADVEQAIADRAIVRTWPMRGTLHYAPAADVRWMLRLLAPRPIARAAGRHRELGLDDDAFRRSARILTRALEGGHALTRAEVYETLERGGVSPEGQRGIHIVGRLAQEGLLCQGARRGKQLTFVLLEEWLPRARERSREEGLAVLASRYFTSHGPATLHDFAWWSGLPVKDAQAAIAEAGKTLVSADREGRTWVGASTRAVSGKAREAAVLLPIWDEYLVAYKDRDAAVVDAGTRERRLATVGSAIVLIDGCARGVWRRTLRAASVRTTVQFWTPATATEWRAVERAAARYGRFVGLETEIEGLSR
jgi:hypothetical protein